MVNVIILQGRLTRDVDVRFTNSNVAVGNFGIAVDRDFKSASGERETDFVEVVVWRATAEFAKKYFKKGDMIILTGRLQTRSYTDKDGNNRKAFEVVADTVNFAGAKNDNGSGNAYAAKPTNAVFAEIDDDGEDLPF